MNPSFRERFDEVLKLMDGRWEEFFASYGDLSDALKSYQAGRGGDHVSCPVHGGKNGDAFRLFDDFDRTGGAICNTCGAKTNGVVLLSWLTDRPMLKDSVRELEDFLGIRRGHGGTHYQPAAKVVRRQEEVSPDDGENPEQRRRIQRLWARSLPADHPDAEPLRRWLQNRGLDTAYIPRVLRYVPDLPYVMKGEDGEPMTIGSWPGMVARVEKDGELVTLHRTWLNQDGEKAAVPKNRKVMTPIRRRGSRGGAIRLFKPQVAMGFSEGIEKALAVRQATRLPMWATVSASYMESLEIPDEVERCYIWADLGKAGYTYAESLAARARDLGKEAIVLYPVGLLTTGTDGKDPDWGDVYKELGAEAFPQGHDAMCEFAATHPYQPEELDTPSETEEPEGKKSLVLEEKPARPATGFVPSSIPLAIASSARKRQGGLGVRRG